MSSTSTQPDAEVITEGARLVVTKRFQAPAALVFEAMTEPRHIRRWWGAGHGEVTVCEVDLRVGGRWHFAMATPDGQEVSFSGEYREVDPPGRLVHTERFDTIQSPESLVETSYTEEDGVTTLHAVITYDSPQTVQMVLDSGMVGGMNESYAALQGVLDELRGA